MGRVVVRFRGTDFTYDVATPEDLRREIAVHIGVPVDRQKFSKKLPDIIDATPDKPLRVMLIGTVSLPEGTPTKKLASASSLASLTSPVLSSPASNSAKKFPRISSTSRMSRAASLEELRDDVGAHPDDPESLLKLAEVILDNAHPTPAMGEEALSLAERAMSLLNLQLALTEEHQQGLALAKGGACVTIVTACLVTGRAENYEKAIQFALQASTLVPEYSLGHVVGFALHRAGKSSEAISFLRAVSSARPNDLLPKFFLAIILADKLLADGAVEGLPLGDAMLEAVRCLRSFVGDVHEVRRTHFHDGNPISDDDIAALTEKAFWAYLELSKLAASFVGVGPDDTAVQQAGITDEVIAALGGRAAAMEWAKAAQSIAHSVDSPNESLAVNLQAVIEYVAVSSRVDVTEEELQGAETQLTEIVVQNAVVTSADFAARALQAHALALKRQLTTRQMKSICELICLLCARTSHLVAASLLRGLLKTTSQIQLIIDLLPTQAAPRFLMIERLSCSPAPTEGEEDAGDSSISGASSRLVTFVSTFGVQAQVDADALFHYVFLTSLMDPPLVGELAQVIQVVLVFKIPLPAAEQHVLDQIHDTLVRKALSEMHVRMLGFAHRALSIVSANGTDGSKPSQSSSTAGEMETAAQTLARKHLIDKAALLMAAIDESLLAEMSGESQAVTMIRDSFLVLAAKILEQYHTGAKAAVAELVHSLSATVTANNATLSKQ